MVEKLIIRFNKYGCTCGSFQVFAWLRLNPAELNPKIEMFLQQANISWHAFIFDQTSEFQLTRLIVS